MSDYAYRIENDIYYTKQLHPQDAVFFCKKYLIMKRKVIATWKKYCIIGNCDYLTKLYVYNY